MRDWLTERPIAHRGLHDEAAGVIENTPSAFRAAIEAGYSIECDVQLTGDGDAIVHHDDSLGRLTQGTGRIAVMTAEALKRIAFKATADHMLTLGELCDLVAGRVALIIELKGGFTSDVQLARRATEVLKSYPGPAALMSFDPALISAVRAHSPALRRGLVGMKREAASPSAGMSATRYVGQAIAARPQFLAYRVQDLDTLPPRLARHAFGLPLLTWTVRTVAERARAARYADQMIFEGFRP